MTPMRLVACLLAVAVTSATARAGDAEGPRPVPPQSVGVGRLVPDLAATAIDGRPVALAALAAASKAVVVALTSTSCPLSRRCLPTLAKLEADFAPRGVAFVYVNPIATDDAAAAAKAVAAAGLKGLYVHDAAGAFAAGLGATSTGDVFVLDAARTLLYRGALDDQYGLGYALAAPRESYARAALSAHLAGRPVATPATTAPGCLLDLSPPAETGFAAVTYHDRVSRIVQANCVECHRAGGVGPFRLDTLADLAAHKGMVRKVVAAGTMPPWHAAPAPGRWANDRSLTPADKADLLAWLGNGLPAGDPAAAPLLRAAPATWAIGPPDRVVQLPEPVAVPASGTVPYHDIIVETGLTADAWVQALEVRPTDRAVVHHVLVFLAGPAEKAGDPNEERDGYFAAYVPGNGHQVFPAGYAKKLPARARLRFQVHYTPSGTATADRLCLGLVFAQGPPAHEVKVGGVAHHRLEVPPHAANHKEVASVAVPDGAVLLAFLPHLHVRGKACRYDLVAADGTVTTLLDVPHYDFHWQQRYELVTPLKVAKGSTLRFTAWYDNSRANPANPDPTATVRWGQQTSDEMMLGYLDYTIEARR